MIFDENTGNHCMKNGESEQSQWIKSDDNFLIGQGKRLHHCIEWRSLQVCSPISVPICIIFPMQRILNYLPISAFFKFAVTVIISYFVT